MALVLLSKAKVKLISALTRKKSRQKHQRFVVEGIKVVQEALLSDWQLDFVVVREDRVAAWQPVIDQHQDRSFFVATTADFAAISSQVQPEGVLAVMNLPASDPAPLALAGPIFVLEDLRDPGNLGTLLRCADWFGFVALVCSPGTVDVFNPKVIRAAMGSIFRVPVYYTPLPDWLSAQTGPVYIADLDGQPLDSQFRFGSDARILIGNEARGVSADLRAALAAEVITIPGSGGAESLNAAMTGAILGWVSRL